MLNYDTERGGIRSGSLSTASGAFAPTSGAFHKAMGVTFFTYCCSVRTDLLASGAQSRLHIAGATFTDSGNYTCMMGRTAKTQIELQIIPGEASL